MNPILLVGAALVGLPILLHLIMKQEPKRLPFPAFRFLKQRLKTNQRKLRLRHFLLLALRMLIIALFCLALYQPSILSSGLISFTGGQPLAVVIVIDTSPSMNYADGDKTHLEEACRRAGELINDLPDGSRIAIIETGDPGGDWLPSASDARTRLNDLSKKAPKAGQQPASLSGAQSVSASLVHAYQLLKTVDEQSDSAEAMPRLVAVFTDRAASSWDASRLDDLKKLRDAIPAPAPAHAIVDVGTDKPVNVAILSAEMHDNRPQIVPSNQPIAVMIAVSAVGLDVRAVVNATLNSDEKPPQGLGGASVKHRKEVDLRDGQTQTLTFDYRDLAPGLHQIKFALENKDALMADNDRYFTFRVAEARKVLAIVESPLDPANGDYGDAQYWRLAINVNREFACDVVKSDAVPPDLSGFEAVTLLSVAKPDAELWGKLQKYVEGGGKLIIIPGDERLSLDAYNGEAASKLMPGEIKEKPIDVRGGTVLPAGAAKGVAWSVLTSNDAVADRELQHPMLAMIREWKKKPDVDAVRIPRRAQKFWPVEKRGNDSSTIVTYDTPAGSTVPPRTAGSTVPPRTERYPAILERNLLKGKVLLLTTKMDPPGESDWNDYWQPGNAWAVAFPDMLLRYAAGSVADANFNHPCGAVVNVPLAKLLAGRRDNLILTGPGIAGTDALIRLTDRQTELRLGPPRTNASGNFKLVAAGAAPAPAGSTVPPGAGAWTEGFSLNVPAEESTLDKAPAEGIEDLTGKDTVIPVGKNVPLADILAISPISRHPVELFPWLLIAVLMMLVLEGLLANRFYRRRETRKST